jgi:hypothetical protein
MFMPLMGLLLTAAAFSIIAVIMLALIPGLRVRLWSVVAFVLCEYAGATAFSMIYTPRFATGSGELTTRAAVLGYFAGAFASAVILGIVVVSLVTFILARYKQRDATRKA